MNRKASPTVMQQDGFRFYFYNNETDRAHCYVENGDNVVTMWLEPAVDFKHLPASTPKSVKRAVFRMVRQHRDALLASYREHFPVVKISAVRQKPHVVVSRRNGDVVAVHVKTPDHHYKVAAWPYPEFQDATRQEMQDCRVGPGGIRWIALDVDVDPQHIQELHDV